MIISSDPLNWTVEHKLRTAIFPRMSRAAKVNSAEGCGLQCRHFCKFEILEDEEGGGGLLPKSAPFSATSHHSYLTTSWSRFLLANSLTNCYEMDSVYFPVCVCVWCIVNKVVKSLKTSEQDKHDGGWGGATSVLDFCKCTIMSLVQHAMLEKPKEKNYIYNEN